MNQVLLPVKACVAAKDAGQFRHSFPVLFVEVRMEKDSGQDPGIPSFLGHQGMADFMEFGVSDCAHDFTFFL
jgi:hypothetical protein